MNILPTLQLQTLTRHSSIICMIPCDMLRIRASYPVEQTNLRASTENRSSITLPRRASYHVKHDHMLGA